MMSVVVKTSETSVEAVVSVKKESSLKTIVGVVDVNSGDVKFIGEKQVEVNWEECEMEDGPKREAVCEKYEKGQIIEAESVIQTTVVSSQIYQQVLTHNVQLQQATHQLVLDYPILENIIPADTVMEVVGDKVLLTFAFDEQKLLLQYSLDSTT